MQQSQELCDFVLSSLRQLVPEHISDAMNRMTNEPGMLFIGTQPTEWLDNRPALEALFREMSQGSSGNLPPDLQIQAWQEGSVGWGAYHFTLPMPNDSAAPLRWTFVAHQEGGGWKFVMIHGSVGIPDDQVPSIAQPG